MTGEEIDDVAHDLPPQSIPIALRDYEQVDVGLLSLIVAGHGTEEDNPLCAVPQLRLDALGEVVGYLSVLIRPN